MANLHGLELKILLNIASLLKNMFAVSPVSANKFGGPFWSLLFFFVFYFSVFWFCMEYVLFRLNTMMGSSLSFLREKVSTVSLSPMTTRIGKSWLSSLLMYMSIDLVNSRIMCNYFKWEFCYKSFLMYSLAKTGYHHYCVQHSAKHCSGTHYFCLITSYFFRTGNILIFQPLHLQRCI